MCHSVIQYNMANVVVADDTHVVKIVSTHLKIAIGY